MLYDTLILIKSILSRKMAVDQCCICFDNLVDTRLQCSHEFCQECITEVLNRDNNGELSCPMCRNPTFMTSNPEINQRILGIEFNRNDMPPASRRNAFEEFFAEIFGAVHQGHLHDINLGRGGELWVSVKSTHQSSYESSAEDKRCTAQRLNPRWNWPSHKMSDYYKLYKTPQITV